MDISDFAAGYLVDKKEGLRHLTASLLNEVMQLGIAADRGPTL